MEGGGCPELVAEAREDGGTGTRGEGEEEAVRKGGGGGAVAVTSEVSRY